MARDLQDLIRIIPAEGAYFAYEFILYGQDPLLPFRKGC
jgi:hypothetical protein